MTPRKPKTAPPPPEPDTPAESAEPYTVGTWAGRPNYECRFCRYATLDLEAIHRHVAGCRRRPTP